MISSFSKFFTKEHYQPKDASSPPSDDNGEECFPCLAVSAALLLGLGTAFGSGAVFSAREGKKPLRLSPAYMRTVRGIGFALIPLGLYRTWRAWELFKEERSHSE